MLQTNPGNSLVMGGWVLTVCIWTLHHRDMEARWVVWSTTLPVRKGTVIKSYAGKRAASGQRNYRLGSPSSLVGHLKEDVAIVEHDPPGPLQPINNA